MRRMAVLVLVAAVWAQDERLVEAERRMEAREFVAALRVYDEAIAAAPTDPRGHLGRARALRALRKFDDALASVTRAIELAPEPDAAHFELRGLVQLGRGDEASAFEDFTAAIELDPGRNVYRAMADLRKARYDYEGAVRDYGTAYELDPDDITALERRGATKESLRDFKGAIEDYTLVAAAVPDQARPLELRGDAKRCLGDAAGAIADYGGALERDPENVRARIGRARARLALGDREAADEDARKSARGADSFATRGRYWFDTGRFKEAAEDLAKAVGMDPQGQDYTRLYLLLARARLGQRAEAAADLLAYLEARPAKDWYWRVARFLSGDMKEEDLLLAATRLKVGGFRKEQNDNRSREWECEACWYAGAVRLLDGDAKGAKALFERSVATDVRTFIEYESAKMALAAMAWAEGNWFVEADRKLEAGDQEGALEICDRAIAVAPRDYRARGARAQVLLELGRLDEALSEIERAIEWAGAPSPVYLHARSRIRAAKGDEAGALADIDRALEIDPRAGPVYLTRGNLSFGKREYEAALRDYAKALDLGVIAFRERAGARVALRDWKGALADCTALAEMFASHPYGFYMRADIKAMLGDWKGAIEDYDLAIAARPHAPSYVGRARARFMLGDLASADADAAKAVETCPCVDCFAGRGRYYLDTGRPREAAADLARALEMEPDGQDYARLSLFLARARLGEHDAAAAELKAFADGRARKDDWYGKVAAFLLGASSEQELLAAAKAENEHRTRELLCEACWYAGAVRLLDGDAKGAKALFERSVATDVRTFREWESARMALAAMK